MNATDTINLPPEFTLLQPAAVTVTHHDQSPPSTLDSQPETTPQRHHRKIAKLPKPLRELINSMLDDGCPAREIIAPTTRHSLIPFPR